MKRLLSLAVLVVCCAAAQSVVASDLPVVRQPNDAAFSSGDRAALSAAWTAISDVLRPDYSLSRLVQLRGLAWSSADYAQFVAGTLESAGYPCLLATGTWAGTSSARTWVLVGVPVSSGTAYLPVEASPEFLLTSSSIGQIAWQGGAVGTSFDPRYLSFAQALAPAPNVPPAVSLIAVGKYVAITETTTFQVLGVDPDGAILGYVWWMSDGTETFGIQPVFWHDFEDVGEVTVTVGVLDTRGGRTNLTLELDVLEEMPDCGCGG